MASPFSQRLAMLNSRLPSMAGMLPRIPGAAGMLPRVPGAPMPAPTGGFAGPYLSGPQAMTAVDQTINRDLNYDATPAFERTAQGAWNSVSDGLRQTLADTRGRSVGAGRFDSGYLDEDQGMVIRQTANDFSNNLAQQALSAEGLTQSVRGRGEEGLFSRAGQIVSDERERAAQKRKKKRGIFGAIGTALGGVGGFLLGGGPAGAAAGAKIGGSIGGAF